jgi:pyruvate dehydrogenase E2 component (dihydrolipoamide acetyltransferase)
MIQEIFMPKLTHDMQSGLLVRWLKNENDFVKKDEPIFEVETDKAISEVTAEREGYLRGICAEADDDIPVGTVIAFLTESLTTQLPEGAGVPSDPHLSALPPQKAAPKVQALHEHQLTDEKNVSSSDRIFISPIARRLAEEHGIDIYTLQGSGPRGRIVERDILAHVSQNRETQGAAAFTERPLTAAEKAMADRMLESVRSIPQFNLEMAVCLEALNQEKQIWEQKNGKTLTYTAIMAYAVAQILPVFPLLNAALTAPEAVRLYDHINLGVAMQSSETLFVPVIHQAEMLSLPAFVDQLLSFKTTAESGGFTPQRLSGGTFTLSNLGMYGVDSFTALIVPPQTGILAVGAIHERVVRVDDGIRFLPYISLRLSCDHRLITGVYASQFLQTLQQVLENPQQLFHHKGD